MDVELQPASYEDKPILRNLLQLCLHDYSEFDDGHVNTHGLFEYKYLDHYWTEESRFPFLLRESGNLAGFVLVRDMVEQSASNPPHSIAEFFVLRKYRRKGIGKTVAFRIFDEFPGEWVVSQSLNNVPAQTFWRTVISEYVHGKYQETQTDETNVITFRT